MTGWTWEYIDDHMTIPRIDALVRYWKKVPPAHMAGMTTGGEARQEESDFGELIQGMPMS